MTLFIDRFEHTYFESFKEQEDAHFSPVMASRLLDPVVVSSNKLLAEELGIDQTEINQLIELKLSQIKQKKQTLNN